MCRNRGFSFNYLYGVLFTIALLLLFIVVQEKKRIAQVMGAELDLSLNRYLPLLVLFIFVFFVIILFRRIECLVDLDHNLKIFSELLNTSVKRPFFGLWLYRRLEGIYKGRNIVCKVTLIGRMWDKHGRTSAREDETYIDIYMPLQIRKTKWWFFIPTIKLSDDMRLQGKSLHYESAIRYMILWQKYSREEITTILDKLVATAERVEADLK